MKLQFSKTPVAYIYAICISYTYAQSTDTAVYDTGEESADSNSQDVLAPIINDVIRINASAVVLQWQLTSEESGQLQYFKIQYKPLKKDAQIKTENKEINYNSRAHLITGLRPGEYLFWVIAVDTKLTDYSSQPKRFKLRARKNVQLNELPDQTAPVIFWQEAGTDYFRLKWKYNYSDNNIGYIVYYRSAHVVSDFSIYLTEIENVEVVELEPDTPYEAKVQAHNKVGVSNESLVVRVQTKSKTSSTPTTTSTTIFDVITTAAVSSTTIPPPTTAPEPPIIIKPSPHNYFYQLFNQLSTDTKYDSLIIMVPISFVVIVALCVFCCRKKPQQSSSTDHFDLEIHAYFKNSFPGLE